LAQASYSVSGDTLTLTLASPIVFVTTTAESDSDSGGGSVLGLIIQGAYSTTPGSDFQTSTAFGSMTLSTTSQTFTPATDFSAGYADVMFNDFGPGDLTFGFDSAQASTTISVGTDFILSAGTYSLTGNAVPALPDFTATTIDLVDGEFDSPPLATSAITMVPEPSTFVWVALSAAAGLVCLIARSRQCPAGARPGIRLRRTVSGACRPN
jgi:hypothetical protein